MSELSITGSDLTQQHALDYITRGWAVFLLATDGKGGKVPPRNCPECDWQQVPPPPQHDMATCGHLFCHGFHAATTNPTRLTEMLAALPNGYLAIRTGRASRLLVIDAEAHARPGEPTGLDVLDEWEAWTAGKAGSLPYTLRARSVSGGQHWFYRLPDGVPIIRSGRVVQGVDVKAEFGYVGAVRGDERRVWLNPGVEIATAPVELLEWLAAERRIGGGRGGSGIGSDGKDAAPGYDFNAFVRDGCPFGYREYFSNSFIYQLRKKNPPLTLEEITERTWDVWTRFVQPPEAPYEMPWEDVQYKINRVWAQVVPDEEPGKYFWPGVLQPRVGSITKITRAIEGEIVPSLDSDLTETGNEHRYVRLFENRALYVPGVGWHLWDDNVFKFDELNDVFNSTQLVLEDIRNEATNIEIENEDRAKQLLSWRNASSTMAARSAMLRGASADPRMKTAYSSLNENPYLLVVPNGTIELRDRKHRISEPSDRNTQRASVLYDADARCVNWIRHIKRVTAHEDGTFDPELELFVQRWFGYTLTGLVSEQKFFFGFGDGANGKNVTIETLLALLGTYAIRGSSKLLLGDGREHETVIADLAGVRMTFIDETPRGHINEPRLKELTGTGKIRARKISKDSFEFEMKSKIWIAGNNKPRVNDTAEGFWRRLDLVPFDVTLPRGERVKDYAQLLLRDEGSGILNWALDGLRDYLDRGLEPPSRVLGAGQSYRDDENTTGQFIGDTFENSEKLEWHPNRVILALHQTWCEQQGIKRTLSMQQISQDLRHDKRFHPEKNGRRVRWLWPNPVSKVERGWVGPPLSVPPPSALGWDGDREPAENVRNDSK